MAESLLDIIRRRLYEDANVPQAPGRPAAFTQSTQMPWELQQAAQRGDMDTGDMVVSVPSRQRQRPAPVTPKTPLKGINAMTLGMPDLPPHPNEFQPKRQPAEVRTKMMANPDFGDALDPDGTKRALMMLREPVLHRMEEFNPDYLHLEEGDMYPYHPDLGEGHIEGPLPVTAPRQKRMEPLGHPLSEAPRGLDPLEEAAIEDAALPDYGEDFVGPTPEMLSSNYAGQYAGNPQTSLVGYDSLPEGRDLPQMPLSQESLEGNPLPPRQSNLFKTLMGRTGRGLGRMGRNLFR